jgi:hypothetical protein
MVIQFTAWEWVRGYIPGVTWRVGLEVEEADEIPERIPRRTAVVVPEKWLAFECPCWRGHQIMVNISQARKPTWKVLTSTPLSVIPSVDERTRERHCHYIVRRGHIDWVQKEFYK